MIDDIQKEIVDEFIRRKIQPYSSRMNLEQMISWSDWVSKEFSIDSNQFESNVKEIFWGSAALQLNVGYVFISLRSSKETGGKKRTATTLEIPENYGMSELHCWYHLSNCWESIYRVWERIVSILVIRFTPNISKKFYFTDYANFLKNRKVIFESDAKKLERYFKHWNNVAKKRNEISHGNFNPFKKMEVTVRPVGNITPDFKLPVVTDYSFPNLKQEVDALLNAVDKTFELIETHIELCELKIQPNKKIMWDAAAASPHI
jgi:hypothetical protein